MVYRRHVDVGPRFSVGFSPYAAGGEGGGFIGQRAPNRGKEKEGTGERNCRRGRSVSAAVFVGREVVSSTLICFSNRTFA
jgi:hypothetical protein